MNFNPIFPEQYRPTNQVNTHIFIDSFAQFSDLNDAVGYWPDGYGPQTSIDYPIGLRGKYILLHAGNDAFRGTNLVSLSWDNIANGNQGNDLISGFDFSRDFLRGGKDDDRIYGDLGGDDFLLGDAGSDLISASIFGTNILRGGRGDDILFGHNGMDLLIGDFGVDILQGAGGKNFFVLRSDAVDELTHLSKNKNSVDVITDFSSSSGDYIVLPGVTSYDNIRIEKVDQGSYTYDVFDQTKSETITITSDFNYLISIIDPELGELYAGRVNADDLKFNHILINEQADFIYSAANADNPSIYLDNPNVFNI